MARAAPRLAREKEGKEAAASRMHPTTQAHTRQTLTDDPTAPAPAPRTHPRAAPRQHRESGHLARRIGGGSGMKRGGGLTGGAEGVARGELPHAGEELREAAAEERHADDDVRHGDVPHVDVVQRQDERRRREREQAPASRLARRREP